MRLTLAIAAALLLLATVAAAEISGAGILGFLNPSGQKNTLPGAERLIETGHQEQCEIAGLVRFTVSEAASDGVYLYLTVQAQPLSADVLLLCEDEAPDDPTRGAAAESTDKAPIRKPSASTPCARGFS